MKKLVLPVALMLMMKPLASSGARATLLYGESSRPEQLNPHTSQDASAYRLVDLLFDSLIELSGDYTYKPSLCESYSIDEHGRKVVFELRKNVKWHPYKGKVYDFTANDVVDTVRLILAKDSEVPNKSRFEMIESVRALDSHKVLFNMKRPSPDPLRHLGFKVLPAFRFRKVKHLTRDHSFGRNPSGTGPYVLEKITPNGEIRLKANRSYFKGAVSIPAITMKPFSDRNILTQALLFGSLDLLTYVSPRRLTEIVADVNFEVSSYESISYSFIALNTKDELLSNKLFRQALSYSINRKEMLSAFFNNHGTLISGPFPPTSWAYNLDVKRTDYDVKRAKSILRSLGYQYDKDGNLLKAQGKDELNLSFLIPLAGEKEMNKRIGLALQSYLRRLGIGLRLEFVDWQVWQKRVLGNRNFQLTIAMWNFDDAANIESLFHSSEIKPWGNNFVQYSNPEVDALLAEAAYTNDSEKKTAIYHKLHSILAVENPYLYLWTLKKHAAYQRSLASVRVDPFSFFRYIRQWKTKELDKVM